MLSKQGLVAMMVAVSMLCAPSLAFAWSNGPDDGNGYGTHDWVLDEALDLSGETWVDREAALLKTDDPDTLYGDEDKIYHTFMVDGDYRGAPAKVAELYYDAVVAYQEGRLTEASEYLGLLSHYYSDIGVPYHTFYNEADAADHLAYELEVDSNHRDPGDAAGWITPRSRRAVTDIRQQTVDMALASRATYASLRSAYASSGYNSTVDSITKSNLSMVVNGLADVIRSIADAEGVSGPGTVSASVPTTYVGRDKLARVDAKVVDASGDPIEGVLVRFTWPKIAGTVVDIEFTDENGLATSWELLGKETYNKPLVVTATSECGGKSSTSSATLIPTEVIGYIKTGVSNHSPEQGTLLTVRTVILNEKGKPISGLPVTFTWTHKTTTLTYTTKTNAWGVAYHQRNIGQSTLGFRVYVKAQTQSGGINRSSTASWLPKSPLDPVGLSMVKVEGSNRFETAVKISAKAFPNGADTVLVATGRSFPDALGGAALAGGYNAPILLVEKTSVPSTVKAEIQRLGAKTAIILGGTGAVSTSVESSLRSAGITTIKRYGEATRYSTARKIAQAAIAKAGAGWDGTAFVATGVTFPDALAASPLSAFRKWPIYLSNPAEDPATLISQMKADGVKRVIILGGSAAVSKDFETAARSALGSAERIAGDDRYDTGALIAEYGVESCGLIWDGVAVATGQDFPDALAGGMLGSMKGTVILLTGGTNLSPDPKALLTEASGSIGTVHFLGGSSVLKDSVRDQIGSLLD